MVEFETKTFYRDGRAIVGVRTPKGWIDYDTYKKNPARFGGRPAGTPPFVIPPYAVIMDPMTGSPGAVHGNAFLPGQIRNPNTPGYSTMPPKHRPEPRPLGPIPYDQSQRNEIENVFRLETQIFNRNGVQYLGVKSPKGWIDYNAFIKNPSKFGGTSDNMNTLKSWKFFY